MAEFKSLVRRLLPKSPWDWTLCLFVAICALRPWLLSAVLFPSDPEAVRILYRSQWGDISYFPLVQALASGNGGEEAVYESLGQGVQSFPVASLMFHVLGTALFGTYLGFILADIVVTVLFFRVLRGWCRLFSANEDWAGFLAAVVACGFPSVYLNFNAVWGQRLPRPFVTDLYFMAGLSLLVWLVWKPERMARFLPWMAFGAILALCWQSYLYNVPVLGLAAVYAVAVWMLREDWPWRLALTRIGSGVFVCLLLTTPFDYQLLFQTPDAAARLGVFPVDRWTIWRNPLAWSSSWGVFQGGLYYLLILGMFVVFARRLHLTPMPGRVFLLLLVFQASSLVALPFFGTLTGKLIQPYHYEMVSRTVQVSILIALAGYVGGGMLPRGWGVRFLTGALLLVCFQVVLDRDLAAAKKVGHLKVDIYSPPTADYHAAFSRLVRELERDTYKNDRVLATTDFQIYAYWLAFHRGCAFFPDNFESTLSDRELEDRLLWFAREVRLEPESLALFLQERPTLVYWLGSDRFQCSRLYQKAPLSDYLPEDLERNMTEAESMNSFALALPKSDLQRLENRYAQILQEEESRKPRLDLIILTADRFYLRLPDPDPSRYVLTYHDENFQVWQARKSP